MHTIVIVYNNFFGLTINMKSVTLLQKSHQVGEKPTSSTFFPRIIREFEDDDDEPMYYGGKA